MIVETSQSVFQSATGTRAMTLKVMNRSLIVMMEREGLRVEYPRPQEDFKVITESTDLSCGQRRSVEAHRLHVVRLKLGGADVGGKLGGVDASTAKARRPSPGLEGVNDFDAVILMDPLVALEESPPT